MKIRTSLPASASATSSHASVGLKSAGRGNAVGWPRISISPCSANEVPVLQVKRAGKPLPQSLQVSSIQIQESRPAKKLSAAMASTMMAKTFLGASLAKAVPTAGKVCGAPRLSWRFCSDASLGCNRLCLQL